MYIQTLRLADVCAPISSEIEDFLLRNLPDGLVYCFDVSRDIGDVLDRAIMRDDHVLHVVIPKTEVDEFAEKPWANYLEFSSKDTASVDVAVNLDEFREANNRSELNTLCMAQSTHCCPISDSSTQ